MCGIAGYIDASGHLHKDDLKKAMDRMHYRGPDAEGAFIEQPAGLGHRRLSIIDTSEAANQPMVSASGKTVCVLNGEIYNFRDIAVQRGMQTKTHSDTEVLLEAWELHEQKILSEINGMFAAAFYNRERKTLSLIRDAMGEKPLYYFSDGQVFAFASEMGALLCFTHVKRNVRINNRAINAFLHLGFIPGPETIYEHVFQLPPGHSLTVTPSGISMEAWWMPEDMLQPETLKDEREALAQLKILLGSSVSYRMICDVPFGTLLSGGIDSSLITAIAAAQNAGPVNTFSVGFPDAGFDESRHARKVARFLGTNHHEYILTDQMALSLMEPALVMFGQPFADTSALPTYWVAKQAAAEVKMVLTGDGGDELFLGYGAYTWAKRLHNPVMSALRKPIRYALNTGASRYKRAAGLFSYREHDNLCSHILSQEQYFFSQRELQALMRSPGDTWMPRPVNQRKRELKPQENQALFDMQYYLPDDLLVKVDRTSMRASLECRAPLLDQKVVAWSLNLDPALKQKGDVSKYLLKKLLYQYIPESYFDRPKWGFAVPLSRWMKGPLQGLVAEYLSESSVASTELFNFDRVSDLLKRYHSGNEDYLHKRIWALVVLQKFLADLKR